MLFSNTIFKTIALISIAVSTSACVHFDSISTSGISDPSSSRIKKEEGHRFILVSTPEFMPTDRYIEQNWHINARYTCKGPHYEKIAKEISSDGSRWTVRFKCL